MRDKRLDDKAWRLRTGFDNIAKPLWSKPTISYYHAKKYPFIVEKNKACKVSVNK